MERAKNLLFLASFVAGTLKLQIEMQFRRQNTIQIMFSEWQLNTRGLGWIWLPLLGKLLEQRV